MVKKTLASFLLLAIAVHAPWRLAALIVETALVSPGTVRQSADDDKYWDCLDLEGRIGSLGWEISYESPEVISLEAGQGKARMR